MDQKLIAHVTPTISLLADAYQYILIIRSSPTQLMRNGHHTYHPTIGASFEEILSHLTKSNLANGENKTMIEVATIVENTIQEVRRLFKAFEELAIVKKN